MTNRQAIEVLIKALPNPELISNIESFNDNAIRFTWNGQVLEYDYEHFLVDSVDNDSIVGESNIANLMTELVSLKQKEMDEQKKKNPTNNINFYGVFDSDDNNLLDVFQHPYDASKKANDLRIHAFNDGKDKTYYVDYITEEDYRKFNIRVKGYE